MMTSLLAFVLFGLLVSVFWCFLSMWEDSHPMQFKADEKKEEDHDDAVQ